MFSCMGLLRSIATLAVFLAIALEVSGELNKIAGSEQSISGDAQHPKIPIDSKYAQEAAPTSQAEIWHWYTPLKKPEWWLVGVGFSTLIFVGWQAWETRKAASAASKQIAIQKETLRPRLSVSNFVTNTYNEAALGRRVCIDIKIANSGGIPAYDVIPETWIEFIERGPTEHPFRFSSKAKYHKSAPINVDTGNPQGFEIPFSRCLNEEEIAHMRAAKGTICFRIRLTYLAFDKECHYDHAFAITPNAAQSIAEYTSAN